MGGAISSKIASSPRRCSPNRYRGRVGGEGDGGDTAPVRARWRPAQSCCRAPMDKWTKEAVELLRDVEKAAWLPPAQPEKVLTVVSKIVDLYRRGDELQKADGFDGTLPSSVMGPRVYMLTLARLQRCLLAYLRCRMERIEALRWDVAGILPEENKAMLSENEIGYAERCARLRAAASGAGIVGARLWLP